MSNNTRKELYTEKCGCCNRMFNPTELIESINEYGQRELYCEDCYIEKDVSIYEHQTDMECR